MKRGMGGGGGGVSAKKGVLGPFTLGKYGSWPYSPPLEEGWVVHRAPKGEGQRTPKDGHLERSEGEGSADARVHHLVIDFEGIYGRKKVDI